MKKALIAAGLIFCMAAPAMAGDVKVSGAVELQYRSSSDKYETKGDDKLTVEEVYLKVSKEVTDNVEVLIKLDGSDMDKSRDTSIFDNGSTIVTNDDIDDSKYLEEAQIIFSNIANQPLKLIIGKDEMPFGQDYEKFLLNTKTHKLEIDKIWGMHAVYKIDGVGSVAAAVFERDRDKNVTLTDSYTAKVKINKLVKGLSFEISSAKIGGEDEDLAESITGDEDEKRMSVGAVFKIAGLTLHGEHTSITDYHHELDRDLTVTLAGADYRLGKFLIKARTEAIDDDKAGEMENLTAAGVSYYFSDKVFVVLEWDTTEYDDPAKDDEEEYLLGAKVKF